MKKTFLIISILLPFLTNCSSNPVVETFKPVTDIVRENLWVNAIKTLIYGYPDYPVTRELVESIPYASMKVKIGKGPAGLTILQKKEDNVYSWVSKDSVLLQIRYGRIIRTSGLTNDLVDYFYDSDLPFKQLIESNINQAIPLEERNLKYIKNLIKCVGKDAIKCNRQLVEGSSNLPTTTRMISLSNPEVRALEVIVKTANLGKTNITILEREYEVILFKEIITNRKIGWVHENLFWVDSDTGMVRKSIQQISPNVPALVIEVTKAPSL